MRNATAQYLNKQAETVSIRNNNSSVVIVDGQPVIADNYDVATYLGIDVKGYTEALFPNLLLGIAKTNKSAGIAKGEVSEAVVYGFTDAIVTRRTRAASADPWSSIAAIAAGDPLFLETVGNAFGPGAETMSIASFASNVSVAAATLTVPVLGRKIIAAQAAASMDTGASNARTNATGLLADTVRMKVFVRLMG